MILDAVPTGSGIPVTVQIAPQRHFGSGAIGDVAFGRYSDSSFLCTIAGTRKSNWAEADTPG